MTNNTITEYSSIKNITTILVVMAHATRMFTRGGVFYISDSDILTCITEIIYLFHMPLFVCISGAIYMQCIINGKYKDFGKFLSNKAKRLMIPYLFWGVCYVAPVVCFLNITSMSYVKYVFGGIILGADSRHLWYLWTLFSYFMIVGLMDKLIKRKWNYTFLYICLIVTGIVSCTSSFVPTLFSMNYIVRYLCFFILGMIINLNRDLLKIKLKNNYIIFCFMNIGFILCVLFKQHIILNLTAAFLGIFILFWLVYNYEHYFSHFFITRYIEKNAMGIYILHPMIIYLWFYFVKNKINALLSCAFAIIISIAVSVWGTNLIRKIKLGQLLGE